ncbi:butyrophilin subfamily 1 member A1-like [Pagrus major]|uniref:butyrophilin subfamily 1 member A1-like n=1 Tax=Pagrus major TaxID=143350 RepID=UPI003CC8CF36
MNQTRVKKHIYLSSGHSQVIGQPQPIVAMAGDDVILPCYLEPAFDAVSLTVEWARADLNPRFVHVRREGVELLIDQNPSYIGRTSVPISKLKCGDLSLKLSKVKFSDEGIYRCLVPKQGTQSEVKLAVGLVSSPVLRLSRLSSESSGVLLECESTGWYPEPEVFWLDGEGNLLSAGPTETVRGPDDLYTVSSRVTVERRHSDSFTCRVQQNNTNQTRETHIHIPEDLFVVPSCPVGRIIIVSVVGFICILAAVLGVFLIGRKEIRP